MSMCCEKIELPTSVVRKSLMAKTWYPTNFSGFYVNGKSYYKLTGLLIGLHTTNMCHCDGESIFSDQILKRIRNSSSFVKIYFLYFIFQNYLFTVCRVLFFFE